MTDKRIRIILDSKKAKADADNLNKSMRGVGESADQTTFSMNKLAGAIATVISVQKVAQYADAWTGLQNQLKQTTSTSEQLADVTQALLDVSNRTRAGLDETAKLYTRFRLASDESVISSERLVSVVETINKTIALSGSTTQEASGALLQLSQAFSSGVLRGQEFNSVAEQAPGILRAISAQTGKNIGELRGLAEQGLLTSDVLIKALEGYKDKVDTDFAESGVTIAQAATVARNNLISFVGQVNDATGVTAGFARAIVDASNVLGSETAVASFIENFDIARLTINAASDSVADFSNEIQLAADIGSDSASLIGDAFKNILPNLRSVVQITTTQLAAGFEQLKVIVGGVIDVLKNPFSIDAISQAVSDTKAEYDRLNEVRAESIDEIFRERDAILETAAAARQARIDEAAARKAERDSRAIGGSSLSGVGSNINLGGDKSSGDQEVASAKAVTEALRAELALRTQTAQIYREGVLREDASLYEQQLALIRIREAEELAQVEMRAAADQQRRAEVLAKELEDKRLSDEAKLQLQYQYNEQVLLAEQIIEEQRTQILQEGKKAREELDRAEFNTRLAMVGQLGDKIMEVSKGKSKGIFKIGQTLALAQAAVALPTAVLESFKNGGGYPWGLIPAGLMLANGLQQINSIKNAGKGLGGGGGSVSVPSLGGGASASTQIPTTAAQAELTQQRRIIDLRGVASTDKLTVAQFAALMEDDGAIVTLENARIDAERRNVIGVSGR